MDLKEIHNDTLHVCSCAKMKFSESLRIIPRNNNFHEANRVMNRRIVSIHGAAFESRSLSMLCSITSVESFSIRQADSQKKRREREVVDYSTSDNVRTENIQWRYFAFNAISASLILSYVISAGCIIISEKFILILILIYLNLCLC